MEKNKDMTFEDKIKLLEEIIKDLESGEVPLDDAINKYTEAMKLAKECSDKLDDRLYPPVYPRKNYILTRYD